MRRRTRAQANAAYITRQRRLNAAQRPLDLAALTAQREQRSERARQAAQRTKLHRESKQPTPNHQPPTPKPPRTPDHDNDPPPF
ncbi:hypothetical protein [Mycolicibacterium sp.]|uniref:hypothetical protein n=1 Tax=Mycolicibacterium sp. TaxID=2320850 RepID=UPI003D0E6CE6